MNRSHDALLGVGILLIAAIAAPVAAVPLGGPASQVGETPEATGNGTAETPAAPGAQFSAAVEVHQAEVDGEMDDRTFGVRIARAASNDSKASVVGDRVQSLSDRLAELRDRREQLEEERANGNMSEARYRAEAAGLAARSAVLARQANSTRAASEGAPPRRPRVAERRRRRDRGDPSERELVERPRGGGARPDDRWTGRRRGPRRPAAGPAVRSSPRARS